VVEAVFHHVGGVVQLLVDVFLCLAELADGLAKALGELR
jgi:hypothetical protein